MSTIDGLHVTPRLSRVLLFATEHAKKMGNDWLGVEHMMLALAQEHEGLHQDVFAALGVTHKQIESEVYKRVAPKIDPQKKLL